jgi:hypothetical protein
VPKPSLPYSAGCDSRSPKDAPPSRFLEFFSGVSGKKANRSGLLEKGPLYNVVEAPI